MNNILRIFREKPKTKFKDKYTDVEFTTSELNITFLLPQMMRNPDPNSDDFKEMEQWLERFVKIE